MITRQDTRKDAPHKSKIIRKLQYDSTMTVPGTLDWYEGNLIYIF